MTIANLCCKVLQDSSVPDIGLQYHKHTPKTKPDGSECYCRYNVTPNPSTAAFVPHKLSDDILAVPVVKRGLAGALYAGNFDKLPTVNCAIKFEVEPIIDPPCHIRAIRPKLFFPWQAGPEAGFHVQAELKNQ